MKEILAQFRQSLSDSTENLKATTLEIYTITLLHTGFINMENLVERNSMFLKYLHVWYLKDLDLAWSEIKGKRVLDIGAGSAAFAVAAKRREIEVFSLDNNPAIEEDTRGIKIKEFAKGTPYILGDGFGILPFKNSSFDFVVSHAILGNRTEEELRTWVMEIKWILKPGGEARFSQLRLKENSNATHSLEGYEWSKEEGYRVLKESDPEINLLYSQRNGQKYYSLKK
jgi:SAM-dependent methyltransferase